MRSTKNYKKKYRNRKIPKVNTVTSVSSTQKIHRNGTNISQ